MSGCIGALLLVPSMADWRRETNVRSNGALGGALHRGPAGATERGEAVKTTEPREVHVRAPPEPCARAWRSPTDATRPLAGATRALWMARPARCGTGSPCADYFGA